MAIRGSRRYVPRLVRPASAVRQVPADASDGSRPRGVPSGRKSWRPDPSRGHARSRRPPCAGEREVEVEIVASAQLPQCPLRPRASAPGSPGGRTARGDCAGRVTRIGEGVSEFREGRRGVRCRVRQHGVHAVTDAGLLLQKPALSDSRKRRPSRSHSSPHGMRFIIWPGSGPRTDPDPRRRGGVGQAAVQVARLAGAEVYATAGSPEKRRGSRRRGPLRVGFPFDRVCRGNPRRNRGRGVDVVLNSLSGPRWSVDSSLLSPCGRFVELAKRDIHAGAVLPSRRSARTSPTTPWTSFAWRPSVRNSFPPDREVGALLESGKIHPLRHETFAVGT